MKRLSMKRILVAIPRLAARAVDAILITDTPQEQRRRQNARNQAPGASDPATGVAADVSYTQNSTTFL